LDRVGLKKYIPGGIQKSVGDLSRSYEKIPIEPETKARLKREFAPEVKKLGKLIGVNLIKRWRYE